MRTINPDSQSSGKLIFFKLGSSQGSEYSRIPLTPIWSSGLSKEAAQYSPSFVFEQIVTCSALKNTFEPCPL